MDPMGYSMTWATFFLGQCWAMTHSPLLTRRFLVVSRIIPVVSLRLQASVESRSQRPRKVWYGMMETSPTVRQDVVFFFAASYIILEKMVHSFFWNMGRIISRYILLKSGKRWIQYSRNLEHWESDLGLPCGEKLSGGLFWFLPGLDCRVWVDY